MKRCDVCFKDADELIPLMKSYQTTQIKEVCDECRKVLDDHKSKLQTCTAMILTDWLVSFIENMRAKFKEKQL